MINKTYNKDPYDYTIIYILVILFLVIFGLIMWDNCTGQTLSIDQRVDACNGIERAYIIADYPADVHAVSLIVNYDSIYWNLIAVTKSDVFIDGLWFDSVYTRKWIFSWWSLSPLQQTDTLFSLVFESTGIYGWGDVYWDFFNCEIADFNGIEIPFQYIDGWLRCETTGISEPFENIEQLNKFRNFNLLGQYVRTH